MPSYYVEEQSSLIREYLLTGARDDKQKGEQLASAASQEVGRLLSVNPKQLMGQSLVKVVYEGKKFDYQGNYISPIIETLETGREFKDRER
ncbi:MAG: hypothetical protein M1119_10470 [Firmicutes bacterium]|nr:hypothetical protein [Bacillota bacterium]